MIPAPYTILGSTLSVNKICVLFGRTNSFETEPNKPVSGRRIGLRIRLIRNHIPCRNDQWYFPVNRQQRWSQKWDLEQPNMSSYSVSMHRHLLDHSVVENYETETKMCVDTKMWMLENDSSLSFNSIHFIFNSIRFILLACIAVDKNWVCWHTVHSPSSENDATYNVPIY